MAKYNIDYVCKLAESKGGKCLSKVYKNNKDKLLWQCSKGHQWKTSLGSIINVNTWCKKCSYPRTIKYNLSFCIKEAEKRGGECLASKYTNPDMDLKWKCKEMHIFTRNLSSIIYNNMWCQECSTHKNKKKSISDCHVAAKLRGGKCLSGEYINCTTKMEWQCSYGHIWIVSYSHISSGYWCSECSVTKKKTIADCHALAENNGGKCLSITYKNNKSKLRWICSSGHEWEAHFNSIKTGSWCPRCGIGKSKPQELLFGIIKDIYPDNTVRYNFRGFGWLSTKTGGKQEIDIYIEGIKVAIEYDGRHHFIPIDFSGTDDEKAKKNLINTQRLDLLKNKKIANNPYDIKYFIRFNYLEQIDKKYITGKLIENNIPVPTRGITNG